MRTGADIRTAAGSGETTSGPSGRRRRHVLTAVLLPAILFAGGLLTWRVCVQTDLEMRSDLLLSTRSVAQAINVTHVKALNGSESDLQRPYYDRLKEQLAAVRSIFPQFRFISLLGRRTGYAADTSDKARPSEQPGGTLFFFVDSEPAGSKDCALPGEAYEEAPAAYRQVFATQTGTVHGPATDHRGTWVTGLVPIHDTKSSTYELASTTDAQAMVRRATALYRKDGRERFLKEVNDSLGRFCTGDLYAFAYDLRMTMVAHPVNTELIGRTLLDEKDWVGGKYFRREIRDLALSKGSGWVHYEYYNPVTKRLEPKTTYVERVDDVIVCAGAYTGTGAVPAMVCIDIDAHEWNMTLARAALPPVLTTGMLVLILLIGARLSARRERTGGTMASSRLQPLEPVLAVAIGTVLTVFAAWMIHVGQTRSRFESFQQLAASRTEAVAATLDNLRDTRLEALARYYIGNKNVTVSDFRQFTQYLTKNQAVQAWGWAPAVQAEDKAQFEARIRASGQPGFELWQFDAHGKRVLASGREMYYPLLHVTSLTTSTISEGFDLGSEPLQGAAIEEAARTGMFTGTDPVTLLQETGNPQGMLIFRPVFYEDDTHRLRGFAVAVLRLRAMLASVEQDNAAHVELSVIHSRRPPDVLAVSWDEDNLPSRELTAVRPFFAFGKVFSMTAFAGPEFMGMHPMKASWLFMLVGLALTGAIAVNIRSSLRRREML